MGVHRARQEEGSIMWSVELVTQDVDGGNPLDVIFCAEIGGQKTTELQQCVMTLQEEDLPQSQPQIEIHSNMCDSDQGCQTVKLDHKGHRPVK